MTINLSYRSHVGFSVNNMIDSDDFPTQWGGAAEVEEIITSAPIGTQAATLDVKAAFRTVPVWPPHKAYIVVSFNHSFWLDRNCPFGCSSSGGNHGEVADATLDVWHAMNVGPAVKWVDNFTIFCFLSSSTPGGTWSYAYSLADIKHMVEPLGIPWHPKKGRDFASTFIYIGFFWDIKNHEVLLTDEKRLKFKTCVNDFLTKYSSTQTPFHVAMTLSGSLSHITFVYPHGCSYLSNLYSWISQYPSNFCKAKHYPSRSLLTDLAWWSNMLSNPNWSRSPELQGPVVDLGIWVDASTEWGVGIVWEDGTRWDALKLKKNWRGPFRDIGWLQAIAVEFAVRILERHGVVLPVAQPGAAGPQGQAVLGMSRAAD